MTTTINLQAAIRNAEREVRRLERLPDPARAVRLRRLKYSVSVTCASSTWLRVSWTACRAEWQAGAIVPVKHLRESLVELKRTGLLDLRVEGGTAQVSHGPRTLKIAKRWGIELPEGA